MRASLAGAAQYPDPSLGTQACWHLTCGSVPADPYGLLDITENVWEWIRHAYTRRSRQPQQEHHAGHELSHPAHPRGGSDRDNERYE
jgi:formylglycine-generating enzyme required for sulfatase activity